MQEKELFLKHALINAYKHNGKANKGSVIGRAIAENQEIKKRLKELMPIIDETIAYVNSLSKEEQLKLLKERFPDALEEKKKERTLRDLFKSIFPDLEDGKVKSCFPPGPEKYPHIGHAKAALMNYLLAKEFKGKFILRFEDTNPRLVKEEFYQIFIEDLEWLGIKPDEIMYASDYLDLFYDFAKKLIQEGHAYVCTCDIETIRKNRANGKACGCRNRSVEENLKLWNEMFNAKENKMVLRLKINMQHKNTTMRDPIIFRIIEHEHPRVKARVWPSYDFQNAVLDGYLGITHRLRSKEFELRAELHDYIRKILDLYPTKTYEFARFELQGVETSGRKIRELIAQGKLLGWDDPQLATLRALKRRGFLAESIKEFVISTGLTKSESTLTWDDLIVINRRLLDPIAKRFFMIKEPVKIKIENAPKRKVTLKMHPKADLGLREFECDEFFYIEKQDYETLEEGKLYRLMDNLNFIYKDNKFQYVDDDYLTFKNKGHKIMHWLPANDQLINIEIFTPQHETIKAIAEKNIDELKYGDIIQFERFGFCRLDNKSEWRFIFTHK